VVDEHPARSRLKRKREWITQPQCPDGTIVSGGRIEKWIVARNGSISIDPQDFPQHVAERLRIRPRRVLADCDVQLPVWSKVDGAAVVICRAEIVEFEDNRFAARYNHIAIGGKTADPVV